MFNSHDVLVYRVQQEPPPPLPFLVPPPFLAKGMRTHPRVHERIFYFYLFF